MKNSFEIVRKISLRLGRVGVGILFVLNLSSCGSTATIPIVDDAYYWPEKVVETPAPPLSPEQIQPAPKTNLEYVTVQDTTVTIRIKK